MANDDDDVIKKLRLLREFSGQLPAPVEDALAWLSNTAVIRNQPKAAPSCVAGCASSTRDCSARVQLQHRSRPSPQLASEVPVSAHERTAAGQALRALYPPHGIPPEKLLAKEVLPLVNKWLAERGSPLTVSRSTLQRAISDNRAQSA